MLRVEHKITFEVIFVMFVLKKVNKDRYVDKSPVVCFMVLRDGPFIFWRGRDGKLIEKVGKAENTEKNCMQVKNKVFAGRRRHKKIVCSRSRIYKKCLHVKIPPPPPVQKIVVRL